MDILFEHPWFIVINKPADLLTQAVDSIDSVQTKMVEYLRQGSPSGPTPFVGIPHRLDRVTTGVLVVARNQRSLRRLSEQFATRKVLKKYHAVIDLPSALASQLDTANALECVDYLRKIPDESRGEICQLSDPGAREARLSIRLLRRTSQRQHDSPLGLVEIELETGRMHQIRLQLAHRQAPIVGDALYGSTRNLEQGEFRQDPIALHARSLVFYHPQTAERLEFTAEYPPSWDQFT